LYDLPAKHLRDFGTGYVVVEDKEFKSPPLEWLREEVRSERFLLRKRIPLRSNSPRLQNVALAIYEYKGYTPPPDPVDCSRWTFPWWASPFRSNSTSYFTTNI